MPKSSLLSPKISILAIDFLTLQPEKKILNNKFKFHF